MDSVDLAFAGAVRQADLIRRGEVSARELVELYLNRIERLDPLPRGVPRARAGRG
jgi:amidase